MNVIGTNLSAMRAANASYAANKLLGTAMERLSTGKQINSAKDNAAGLAIATSMTSQIAGIGQGIRNANDGVTLAQTTDGVLGEVTNMLQRIREITVQAANGTYGVDDQKLIQKEVAQLTAQVGATIGDAQFNGVKLIDTGAASSAGIVIQVGADAGQAIVLERPHLPLAAVSTDAFDGLKVDVNTDRAHSAETKQYLQGALDAVVNVYNSTTGPSREYPILKQAALDAANAKMDNLEPGFPLPDYLGSGFPDIKALRIDADNKAKLATQNSYAYYDQAEKAASTYINAVKNLQIQAVPSNPIEPNNLFGLQGAAEATATLRGQLASLNLNNPLLSMQSESAAKSYSDASAINGRANAAKTLGNVDALLGKVATARAAIGAGQSRLESAVSSLTSTATNLTDARSRIEDTDYSAESVALAKAQILSQASTAMLSQANQSQQNIMSLLKS